MYGKAPKKETVYASFVFLHVVLVLEAGQGAYDMNVLASACGLKATHNFKRRVYQMVERGIIKADAVFTETGGLKAVFSLPEVPSQIEQAS